MWLFNTVLILHFLSFLIFAATLMAVYPKKERRLYRYAIFLGIAILITGLSMVMLHYPAVQYNKIVPKLVIFVIISILCGIYSKKALPAGVYFTMLGLLVLASLIGVARF
ncbi:hypothetical protein A8C56_01950 [Niabella ginsenosidivorans]|uniref:Uncharacterized protein n=1 Tax=Niabella ginsenosidivorans TaxID=1176587 RepID=A0A1A9HZL0_9BACT|nr:hypothetical protein [Niabella ginsenosidivorans]ANH79900.1 hypothetical protein A8C56_01950 [Niabella ginsenosidivorans]